MQNYLLQILDSSGPVNSLIDKITPEIPHSSFITDLAIIMILASIVTLAFFKMKQPLIIGYLFAGMLLGPLSPLWASLIPEGSEFMGLEKSGILSDVSVLNIFAELGVILLLFVIGIEFPYSKIKSIGKVAIGAGTIGLFLTLGVVFYVSSLFGLGFMDSLFLGAALSISSTAIIVKILEDTGKIKKESSILVLGMLIVEDIIAVILIATLESVTFAGSISYTSIVTIVIVAAGLIGGTLTVGTKIIPKLIDKVAATEHKEILLLSVLGLCFGYALFANVVGLSVAIGAFLAGVLVAESKSAEVSKILSSPIKDMFVAIFFVSVGALMNVAELGNYIVLAIGLIVVSVLVKFGSVLFGTWLFRQERTKSLRSAFALAGPRGEFSIVIVKTGVDIGAVSSFVFPLIGIISIISAFISPLLVRASDRVIPKLED
ncbi:cation:proton antiporter [Candidatus Nitrosotenuis chungbukensis]|uniref:cation:proton antiporter n=1 Tax=Candidatus Nitrosotenuis chungbukensis TaxID=1353246 RepID=UPI0005B2794D|nr:cation:proton antiporter [Candidatus Nitrosotenuis chungbukensis]